MRSARHFIAPAAALLGSLTAVLAIAQWRVNNQVGQVNRRVGGELYGNNTNMGSVRYAAQSQTRLLPSEERYATWRSGALPSEIAMNAAAVGPLAPNGAISYIPAQSSLQAAMKLPAPNLYNANYDFVQSSKSAQVLPAQAGFSPSSIHYSKPRPVSPPNRSTGQVATRTVKGTSHVERFSYGSIRYSDLPTP